MSEISMIPMTMMDYPNFLFPHKKSGEFNKLSILQGILGIQQTHWCDTDFLLQDSFLCGGAKLMQSQAILAHQPPPPWLSTHIFSSDLGEILFVSFTLLKKKIEGLK